jgi:hypothetical protein
MRPARAGEGEGLSPWSRCRRELPCPSGDDAHLALVLDDLREAVRVQDQILSPCGIGAREDVVRDVGLGGDVRRGQVAEEELFPWGGIVEPGEEVV